MKLKIIRMPSFTELDNYYLPPLGMASIYARLKDTGFDVSQTDLSIRNFQPDVKIRNQEVILRICSDRDRLFRYLKGADDKSFEAVVLDYLNIANNEAELEGASVLLLSLSGGDHCAVMLAVLIARYFKGDARNKIVVLGGAVGEDLRSILKDFEVYNSIGLIDYYTLDSDLESSIKLVKKICGEDIPFDEIHGVLYREGGRCLLTERKKENVLAPADFTGISLKDYAWNGADFFHQMMPGRFLNESIMMLPFRMILGCPNRCPFCYSSVGNQGVSYLDPFEAVSRLKALSEAHHTKYFFFLHDMINISEKFVNDFCDEIIRSGLEIYWTDCASIRNFRSPEIFYKMRKAGACRLVFGMETASPRMLKFIDKKITPEQVRQVVKWSHDAGIWTGLMFITGLPHEQDEDIRKTVDFILANAKYLDMVWHSMFHLADQSLMFCHPENYGITNVREFDGCSFKDIRYSHMNWAFDEEAGLPWEKKLQQIKRSCQMVSRAIDKSGLIHGWRLQESMNVLFYLYTHLKDKDKIKKFYSIYYNHRIRNEQKIGL